MKEKLSYIGRTDRIQLRCLVESDFAFFYDLFNNEEAMKYYPEHRNAVKTRSWIEFNFDHYKKHGYGKWAIEDLSGNMIGHSGLIHTLIDGFEEVELGYFLHPDFWHKGFATEAAGLGLRLACEKFNLQKIVSAINPENTPSIKVAQRLGMKKEKSGIAQVGSMSWACDVYATDSNSAQISY